MIAEALSIENIPSFRKAGVLLIDKYLYTKIIEIGSNVYIDIKVVYDLSETENIIRVNFFI